MLTTDQKGAAAELAIAHLAAELGVGVFKPLTDGERYDLIFDLRPPADEGSVQDRRTERVGTEGAVLLEPT